MQSSLAADFLLAKSGVIEGTCSLGQPGLER